jgi:hypothetical protein
MILVSNSYLKKLNEFEAGGQSYNDDDQNKDTDYTAPPAPVNAAGNDDQQQAPADDANNPPPDDNGGDDDVDYTADTGDDAGGDPGADDGTGDDGGDVDYTADGGGDAGGGDMNDPNGGGGDMGGGDMGDPNGGGDGGDAGGAPPADNGGQVAADDARGMEGELFKDLTPDQLDMKHQELKNNFMELYDSTSSIIDRVNDIPNSDEFLASITFVSEQLNTLRTMVADYMNKVYSTKSYMENAINFNRFLATLNGINDILEEISNELAKQAQNKDDH